MGVRRRVEYQEVPGFKLQLFLLLDLPLALLGASAER